MRVLIFLLFSTIISYSQIINLQFPFFEGKKYDFKIVQGDKLIVLQSGTIQKGGVVILKMPQAYKNYRGMAMWYLTNSETGGGLDMIIANEDFSVSCLDSVPSADNIVYKNTKENIIDKINFQKQKQLFEKHDVMLATLRTYDKKSKLYKLASKEYQKLLKGYELYSKELSSSSLYGAKFRQIVNLTMGIGTTILLDEKEKASNINQFITNELDFEVLYTSNHWSGIIINWIQLHSYLYQDDVKLLTDACIILNRINSNLIYTDFVISLTRELTKAGKDDALFALISEVKKSNRLLHYEGVLNIFKQDLTGKAPDLYIDNFVGNNIDEIQKDTIIETKNLHSKYTLVLFYKSGCGPCEDTIETIKSNYSSLSEKELKIISLSADTDLNLFKKTSSLFPWKSSYCDFKGSNGINFKNYAVIGTPTLYLLDSQGIIISKMSGGKELVDWFDNK